MKLTHFILIIASALVLSARLVHGADDPQQTRLARAKATYQASIEAAKKKLVDEYETVLQAYTRQGNLDDALSVRQERDDFLQSEAIAAVDPEKPAVENGWTILLRSKDPLIWNIAVKNKESQSVPLTAAPRDVKFLRIRRMDSKDYVIVPATESDLSIRKWPAVKPVFRGDKRIDKQSCALGIVDIGNRIDTDKTPVIDYTPAGGFAGWGFGCWMSGKERQAWIWDSKSIDPTVMEIGVTNRELTMEEKKHLVGA